ncbi:MAG TPA: thioredoxin family protein, partial [Ottowia sp.]|nr:thioredoxin family protein [Ottowia sp.]
NLMPCVFPVLAIKVLGFTQHAEDRRAHRLGGLAYTLGVVLSFLALGGLMLALRAAGQQLGWGFQLQSPLVVALLAALFTVIGLNLAGVFEFGRFVPSSVATLEARHPMANAFLSGMLAVAVASPCTAPFMGASLGLAVGLPAGQALAVFGAIGLGMALPYLAASWLPALARLLPRPGAWMEVFRRFMAFPMFGTTVWLLWVLGQQTGIDGAGALLALLVLLALVLWALGLTGRARAWVATIAVASGAFLVWSVGPYVVRPLAEPEPAGVAAGERWAPWSPARVQARLAEGRPVFVDFTAAWCVTCQYNKKTTLASAEVLDAFDRAGVQTLRADWTRRDAGISAELGRLGRSGVPVYLLQAPGKPPVVLSEVLSVADVMAALAQL